MQITNLLSSFKAKDKVYVKKLCYITEEEPAQVCFALHIDMLGLGH